MEFIKKLLGYCPKCRRWFKDPKCHRRIFYEYGEDKYVTCCFECFKKIEEYHFIKASEKLEKLMIERLAEFCYYISGCAKMERDDEND